MSSVIKAFVSVDLFMNGHRRKESGFFFFKKKLILFTGAMHGTYTNLKQKDRRQEENHQTGVNNRGILD